MVLVIWFFKMSKMGKCLPGRPPSTPIPTSKTMYEEILVAWMMAQYVNRSYSLTWKFTEGENDNQKKYDFIFCMLFTIHTFWKKGKTVFASVVWEELCWTYKVWYEKKCTIWYNLIHHFATHISSGLKIFILRILT